MAQRLRTDWVLFVTVILMVSFGLVMVYSASSVVAEWRYHSTTYFLVRQIGWAVFSFFALMWLKTRDYRLLKTPMWAFGPLGVVLALLVLVYFMDSAHHRWFHLGFAGFQPSEFAKPALAIFLAWFVTVRARDINARHSILPASLALAMLAIAVLIADLGTAVVLMVTAAVVFFVGGLDKKYFVAAVAGVLLLAVVAVASKPYRIARIVHFVDPDFRLLSKFDKSGMLLTYMNESKTRDTGYQAMQSKIAVGSGGVIGAGLMQSRQKLLYLPEAHTDMIYAVVGEEMGLFGCTAVLAGFLVLLWRGFRLYWLAPDEFGRYLALGLTAGIVFQALVNISVVLDLGPTKGFPLPMISFGGSSLLSTMISCGLLLSISDHSG
jgi:cell division protein FtsW